MRVAPTAGAGATAAQLTVGVSPTTNAMAAAAQVSAAAASATAPLAMMSALAPAVERAVEELRGAVSVLAVAMTVQEAAVAVWNA